MVLAGLPALKYSRNPQPCRIQQMQLLLQDLRTEEHDKLWKQLDAEIHLHRHKTVVRACRSRLTHAHTLQPQASSLCVCLFLCMSVWVYLSVSVCLYFVSVLCLCLSLSISARDFTGILDTYIFFIIIIYKHIINILERYPQSQALQSSDDIDGATTTTTAASNGLIAAASPNRHQRRRIVTLQKPPHEGLGMSITVGSMVVIMWGLWMWWIANW